jgi:hypothetical protein
MLIDCIFEGFERKSDEAVIAATDNIRNKARALVAATQEAFNG